MASVVRTVALALPSFQFECKLFSELGSLKLNGTATKEMKCRSIPENSGTEVSVSHKWLVVIKGVSAVELEEPLLWPYPLSCLSVSSSRS